MMFAFLKKFFRPKVDPMNVISIDKKAILHNYVYLKSLKPHAKLFPVIKSNAYGHGIDQMLQIVKGINFPYVVVDSFPEYSLVLHHSAYPILLLGETLSKNYKEFDLKRTAFAVYNLETLQALAVLKKKLNVHLFLNTGMNREGIQPSLLKPILEFLKSHPQICIEGVMSHLYDADASAVPVVPATLGITQQVNNFKEMYYQILEFGHAPRWRHIGNSASLLTLEEEFFNAYRPGLALYGYNPLPESHPLFEQGNKLQSALSLSSVIISLNELRKGEGVGYAPQWINEENQVLVATVPFGYAEGFPRCLREKLSYRWKKRTFVQVGSICMNLSMCKGDTKMKIGDKIVLIEQDKDSPLSVQHISAQAEMIPYEFLVGLDKGIRREVVG